MAPKSIEMKPTILLFLFCAILTSCGQKPIIIKTFEDGSLKTTHKVIDDSSIEEVHYFPSGDIRSKGIMSGDVYSQFEAFDEDGTLLVTISSNDTNNVETYKITKYHTNKKVLQTLFYIKDVTRIHTYVPSGTWKSYTSDGQLVDKVIYDPETYSTGHFKSGTSYYNDGRKKAEFTYYKDSDEFMLEQFYPSGTTYFKTTFSADVLSSRYKHQEGIERTDLLSLLREPASINSYIYKRNNNIDSYEYNYPDGKTAVFKKNDVLKIYRKDRTLVSDTDYFYTPNIEGYTMCSSDSNATACKVFFNGTKEDRLNYIPETGKYIIKGDDVVQYTRVYDFSKNKTGTITYYGFNEVKVKELNYKGGKLHGEFTKRHSYSGNISETGHYTDGEIDGVLTTYSETGIPTKFTDNYSNRFMDGSYRSLGTVNTYWTEIYKNEVKSGAAVLKDLTTDEILMKGIYKDGKKDGIWKKYDLDFEVYYPPSVLDYGVNFENYEKNTLISEIRYY